MSEQVENSGDTTKVPSKSDLYMLLRSYELGALDFKQFWNETVKWSKQVLGTDKQKETTLEEK
jgi:hypothetical protein